MSKTNEPQKKSDQKPAFFDKVKQLFSKAYVGLIRSFRDMYAELKKVTWPSRDELKNYSIVVLAFMVFMGIAISIIDFSSAFIVNWIVGL